MRQDEYIVDVDRFVLLENACWASTWLVYTLVWALQDLQCILDAWGTYVNLQISNFPVELESDLSRLEVLDVNCMVLSSGIELGAHSWCTP